MEKGKRKEYKKIKKGKKLKAVVKVNGKEYQRREVEKGNGKEYRKRKQDERSKESGKGEKKKCKKKKARNESP